MIVQWDIRDEADSVVMILSHCLLVSVAAAEKSAVSLIIISFPLLYLNCWIYSFIIICVGVIWFLFHLLGT